MINIIKYRGTYRVLMQEKTTNENDTYLKCKSNTHIYRYNDTMLAIQFNSNGYANNRVKDFKSKGVELQKFVQGDNESVYLFYEKDLSKVADILKPRVKGANKTHKITKKKELSEEQRQKLRDRMIVMRKKGLLEKKQK